MHRRRFLTSLGALTLMPSIGINSVSAAAAHLAGYNRYMYGLGVFHARNHAAISTLELAKLMHITPSQANLMMREMISDGFVAPLANSTGMMSAIDPINAPKYISKVVRSAIPKTNLGKVKLNNFPLESNNSASSHSQSSRINLANDTD